MRRPSWGEVTPGSIIQGRDGGHWTVVQVTPDGSSVVLSKDGKQVTMAPTSPPFVLTMAAPDPAIAQRSAELAETVNAAEAVRVAEREAWMDALPPAESEAVKLVDALLDGEWSDTPTQLLKRYLIADTATMSKDELAAHIGVYHGIDVAEGTPRDLMALSHGIAAHVKTVRSGGVNHTHDSPKVTPAELLYAMAEAGVLYATKQRNQAETLAAAMECFADERAIQLSEQAVHAQFNGMEFVVCSRCDQVRIEKPTTKGGPCALTPGCKGKMQRIANRPRAFKPA